MSNTDEPLLKKYGINTSKSVLDQLNLKKVTAFTIKKLVQKAEYIRSGVVMPTLNDILQESDTDANESRLIYNYVTKGEEPQNEEEALILKKYLEREQKEYERHTTSDERAFILKYEEARSREWDNISTSEEAMIAYESTIKGIAYFSFEKMNGDEFLLKNTIVL